MIKTKRQFLYPLLLGAHLCAMVAGVEPTAKQWQGAIATVAQDEKNWQALVSQFMERDLHYSALAAASRIQTLFSDLPSKEVSFRTIIQLIDLGFPFPIRKLFSTGDIEPSETDSFANSYNLYKGIDNKERKMDRWAQFYFEKIDKENFPKYQFYAALQSYAANDLLGAEATLKKLLARKSDDTQVVFTSKVARTLARIYFERGDHAKSLDIYTSYLLRLNPMLPSDWLESAWNLYHLKRYDEALGFLYNLEAQSADNANLEKYVLRALIYREMCSSEQIEALLTSFEEKYGKIIEGIKSGVPLAKFKILKTLWIEDNTEYLELRAMVQGLAKESQEVDRLPAEVRPLGKHLYRTEAKQLLSSLGLYEEKALNRAAAQLVTFHENIKFLKFDVERERYNPESVFKNLGKDTKELVENRPDNRFQINWNQHGDYWRDERLKYKAQLKNECIK